MSSPMCSLHGKHSPHDVADRRLPTTDKSREAVSRRTDGRLLFSHNEVCANGENSYVLQQLLALTRLHWLSVERGESSVRRSEA